jgi:hypothetical protein
MSANLEVRLSAARRRIEVLGVERREPAMVTQNVTQNSAGSPFRNTPTRPVLPRPHACDLRKHWT